MTDDWLGSYNEKLPPIVKPADFAYWCRMPNWKEREAVAIALGADPSDAWNYVRNVSGKSKSHYPTKPPFAVAYEQLNTLVVRNFPLVRLGEAIKASLFIDWLAAERLPLPSRLVEAFSEFGHPKTDWKSLAEKSLLENKALIDRVSSLETALANFAVSGSANTKERESLQKLVIGMAVKGYRYDPKVGRSGTPKEIADDLAALGISLSDDTVRKYLKDAAEFLPPIEGR
jgi:hypothetical protein